MRFDLTKAEWINRPVRYEVNEDRVMVQTDPNTDFWQRSYYGFRNDNAPALLVESDLNFTFTVRVMFTYQGRYDQSGILLYIDSDNWFKASIEYEDETFSRLGSVVTNLGYSDWATTDIPTPGLVWYRLSRRGPDFLVESSFDGVEFSQMRIFHLHKLGDTTVEMGKADPPYPADRPVRFGLYACSPLDSSFKVVFDNIRLEPCLWQAHGSEG